jgi:hypothetical protein
MKIIEYLTAAVRYSWIISGFSGIFSTGKSEKNQMDMQALNQVAASLNIPADWLNALIMFESSGKPDARNPYSGARGLIQFTDTTARALGYQSADDLYNNNPSDTAQLLGPVLKYFQLPGNEGPYPTQQSLYMTVFYPAARNWDLSTAFPANVQKLNPGIVTVSDYVSKVNHSPIIHTAISAAGVVLIGLAAVLGYHYIIKPTIQERGFSWLTAPKEKPQGDLLTETETETDQDQDQDQDIVT